MAHMVVQWSAIDARIQSLIRASELHASFLKVTTADNGRYARLREQCGRVLDAIRDFRKANGAQLPGGAAEAIDEAVRWLVPRINDANTSTDMAQLYVSDMLVGLGALASEVTYLLAGSQEAIKRRAERAFQHLRRSLAVDGELASKWQRAFETGGEPRCEALGSVHLLQLGIWAFKFHAGARTDLVFPEPISDSEEIRRSAEGFVLTEWKLLNTGKSVDLVCKEGFEQAKLYAEGPLAGIELSGYRYVVIVSMEDVELPPDREHEGVLFRFVNVPIRPKAPSVAARARRRQGVRKESNARVPSQG